MMKHLGHHVWVDSAIEEALSSQKELVVIPDICFYDEYERLKQRCENHQNVRVHVILLVRNNDNSSNQNVHHTDEERFKIPHNVRYENNKSLADLYQFVDEFYSSTSKLN
eukprot:TRINITY_DN4986_c0_g1_i1.p1 TRINITY_DN4986_c0_g1~~TRINITY_DN4986_c0_g1_i1.p1  ORF type:complete len:110 (+),score=16.69 TRINITY_DN4986_c0_g1_i1:340-669(+)